MEESKSFAEPSWLTSVGKTAVEFKKSEEFSKFVTNTKDCSDEEIMNAAAGVYFQWLGTQVKARNGVSQSLDHSDLIYIPPVDYEKEEQKGNLQLFLCIGFLFELKNNCKNIKIHPVRKMEEEWRYYSPRIMENRSMILFNGSEMIPVNKK